MQTAETDTIYLERLTLENWAQFENEKIEFPVPENGNDEIPIIYFLARNGAGKTRLFQALRVGLFGENDFSIVNQSDLFNFFPTIKKERIIKDITNGNAILNQSIRITLTFREYNKSNIVFKHKFQRAFHFTDFKLVKKNHKVELTAKLLDADIDYQFQDKPQKWVSKSEEEFKNIIEYWFPAEIRDFYFFDGEKLNSLMVQNQDRKDDFIRRIILRKSDHFKVGQLLAPIIKLENNFSEQARKIKRKTDLVSKAEEELQKIRKELSMEISELEQTEERIFELEEKISELKQQISELGLTESRLERVHENKGKISEFRKLEEKLDKAYDNLGRLLGEQNRKIYDFEWLLIQDMMNEVCSDMDERYKNGEIPSKIHKGMYDIILTRKKCVCSDEVLSDEKIAKIESEREQAVDERLNDEAKDFLSKLKSRQQKLPETNTKILEARDECVKYINKLRELGDRPAENTNEEMLFIKYMKLDTELDKKVPALVSEKENKKTIQLNIEFLKEQENSAYNLLKHRKTEEGKIEQADLWEFIARKLRMNLELIQKELNDKMIDYIKEQTNKTFLDLIEPKEEYLKIYIDEGWNFGYYMKSSPSTPIYGEYGPSKGQFHVLGIAFLHSISGTTSCKIPIIFDTPLGRIDEIHKQNIGSNITRLFKGTQVILFLTGSEAKDMLDYISGKSGFEIENLNNVEAKCKILDSSKENLIATIDKIERENDKISEGYKVEEVELEGD